jgi:NAD(P)-dependent dehydrogenase (short-subunit alcohol dehydrogenase family)
VTGAGGGKPSLGALAEQGAKVVVNDLGTAVDGSGRNPGLAEQVVQEIRAAGGTAVANTDSVASWDGAQRIVTTALDTFGRVDCIVNNAAILRDTIFHKMTREDWELSIAVVLNGSFYVSRAAAPHFRSQQSGAFVHISSTSGLVGAMGQANYAAGKMGLVGLSKRRLHRIERHGTHYKNTHLFMLLGICLFILS